MSASRKNRETNASVRVQIQQLSDRVDAMTGMLGDVLDVLTNLTARVADLSAASGGQEVDEHQWPLERSPLERHVFVAPLEEQPDDGGFLPTTPATRLEFVLEQPEPDPLEDTLGWSPASEWFQDQATFGMLASLRADFERERTAEQLLERRAPGDERVALTFPPRDPLVDTMAEGRTAGGTPFFDELQAALNSGTGYRSKSGMLVY